MVNSKIRLGKERIAAVSIIFLGFILRLFKITGKNLWFDELLTSNFSKQLIGLKSQWRGVSETSFFFYKIISDPISILYSFLVYFYSLFFGSWESLRYLSLVFSTLCLVVFYKLARLFLNQKESLCALILIVLNPFQIWYAQEAREYSLLCFLSAVLAYLYIKALREDKLSYWIYLGIAGVLSVYTSYYFALLLAMFWFPLLFKENRRHIKKWCLSTLVIITASLPLLIVSIKQYDLLHKDFWLRAPNLKSIFMTFGVLSLGYSSGLIGLIMGTILFILLFIYGAYSQYKSSKNNAVLLLLFFSFPILFAYIISKAGMPIYLDRKFIIFSPFYYIIIAKGIMAIRNRILKITILLIAFCLTSSSLSNYYKDGFMISRNDGKDVYEGVHFKKDYYKLMDKVVKGLDNYTAVCATDLQSYVISIQYLIRKKIADPPSICYFIFYPGILEPYQKSSIEMDKIKFINSKEGKGQLYCAQRGYGGKWVACKADLIDKFDRVWLISSSWNKKKFLSKHSYAVRRHFLNKYDKLMSESEEGILIELFQIKK